MKLMDNVLQTYSESFNQLSQKDIISIIVNAVIFLLILTGSIILLVSLKSKTKGYKLLFVFYLIFWIPIFLGRDFRVKMNDAILSNLHIIGSELSLITTMVLVGYGFVGIFARIFADYFSFLFKYRKAFLYFAVIVNIITFIPIIVVQNQYTSVIQVIGVGISASCIGTVELLFRNQYDENKSFLTVSILSIPPLLANFVTAPIQSMVSTYSLVAKKVYDPQKLSILWIIGLVCLVIVLVMLIFIKENKLNIIKPLKTNDLTNIKGIYSTKKSPKNLIIYFIIIAFIGCTVMFIKFSNSGAIGLKHLQILSHNMSSSYEGYLSVIFSLAQLGAGILMGMVLIRKWSPLYILLLGSGVWVTYLTSVIFIKNPIVYFIIHSLNGFAYGIIYNLLLGLVLVISLNTVRVTTMGIYQSILSIGIACSGAFNSFMKNTVLANKNIDIYFKNNTIVNVVLIISIVLIFLLFLWIHLYFKERDDIFYSKHLLPRKQETTKFHTLSNQQFEKKVI